MQKILPSIHMSELFRPFIENEDWLIKMAQQASEIPFYKGMELPVIFSGENQKIVRRLVEDRGYQLTCWISHDIKVKGGNLSSMDAKQRKDSVAYALEFVKMTAEMGGTIVGLQSGADPGEEKREEAKKVLAESYSQIFEGAKEFQNMRFVLEPLDRYAHKKQLLGPIHEVADWVKELRETYSNFYIHWDSAHEALAGIDLTESLEAVLPYLAQFHLCNCVTEPTHPYFGDHHMEVGRAPEFKNWGYLNVDVAAGLLRRAAQENPPEGISEYYWALEVRSHLGDDIWEREKEVREFMIEAFERAGVSYEK